MLRGLLIAATVFVIGCPSAGAPEHPRAKTDDTALRIRIARAEARRAGGVDELIDLVTHGDAHARELAIRGLGRIGGPQAMLVLSAQSNDGDNLIAAAALRAIGVAASLDEIDVTTSHELHSLLAKPLDTIEAPRLGECSSTCKELRLAAIEAIGRAGDVSLEDRVARYAGVADPELASASALALGRYGRRKLALTAAAHRKLAAAARHPDPHARYAAIYALSREVTPPLPPENSAHDPMTIVAPQDEGDLALAALAAAVTDEDPEIRATAIAGLARRKAVSAARQAVESSLHDRDWRVAVEAVRALAGEHGDAAGRAQVASAIGRRLTELVRGNAAEAQLIVEALRTLLKGELDPASVAAITAVGIAAKESSSVLPLVHGWISCLAAVAASHHAGNLDPLPRCEHEGLDDHLRLPLLGELITAGAGTASARRDALRALLEHADARVRAAGIGALAAMSDSIDHAMMVDTIASAIASPDPIIAGAAVDAAPAIYDALKDPRSTVLDDAIVARAGTERDVELGAALFELIGKRVIGAGVDACRAGLRGAPVLARAAATCLKQLGEAVPVPPIGTTEPPPVDVADVIGKELRWHVLTTRGELVIRLRPDVAPWNVATIVALTRRGFYDGLEFHRVVPDFVVQGGDPTMSGWGGPGFTTPAEPSTAADGPGFETGGIGIADAGRDSGGSQWFVMHSRAPHLDGRYTWIGNVVSGQKSADALLIGDKILRATVEVR